MDSKKLKIHSCSNFQIVCPELGCGCTLRAKQLRRHLNEDCAVAQKRMAILEQRKKVIFDKFFLAVVFLLNMLASGRKRKPQRVCESTWRNSSEKEKSWKREISSYCLLNTAGMTTTSTTMMIISTRYNMHLPYMKTKTQLLTVSII